MPNIDMRIIEALRRQQQLTEYVVHPMQSSNVDNYQILLQNVPSIYKEDVLVVHDGRIIPHWVASKGSIWCKIPKLITTPFKIYTLSGNPSAISKSSGDNVFYGWDQFDTDRSSQYTKTGSGTFTWDTANSRLNCPETGSGGLSLYTKDSVSKQTKVIEGRVYLNDETSVCAIPVNKIDANNFDYVIFYRWGAANQLYVYKSTDGGQGSPIGSNDAAGIPTAEWFTFKITYKYNSSSSADWEIFVNGVSKVSFNHNAPFTSVGASGFLTWPTAQWFGSLVDWWYVRDYQAVEPIVRKINSYPRSYAKHILRRSI